MLTLRNGGPRPQGQLRKHKGFFVNGGHLHLALRELRGEFSHPVTLAALSGVAVILGISGPFGTIESFALLPRLGYWALVVPTTYGAGFLGTRIAHPYLPRGPRALRIALAALGSAIAVTLVLGVLNAGLGLSLGGPRDLALGFAAVYVICLVIEAVGSVLQTHARAAAATAQTSAQPTAQAPALLARLPLEKRGALLALSAEDHYITVVTTRGRDMLLLRLADAIAESAPVAGVQIHRSHWVALAGVASVTRMKEGAEAMLINGDRLPIARARMNAARAAGLLPRKGN